jgi:hypothetical protein
MGGDPAARSCARLFHQRVATTHIGLPRIALEKIEVGVDYFPALRGKKPFE